MEFQTVTPLRMCQEAIDHIAVAISRKTCMCRVSFATCRRGLERKLIAAGVATLAVRIVTARAGVLAVRASRTAKRPWLRCARPRWRKRRLDAQPRDGDRVQAGQFSSPCRLGAENSGRPMSWFEV
jgi:hypothetical protein